MDDSIPIVLDPDDPAFSPTAGSSTASCPGSDHGDTASVDAETAAFLQSLGVSAPATWNAFGLGTVSDAMYSQFNLIGRRRPAGPGLIIPTWLPADPTGIVGLVRMTPGQCKHRFATPPAGIAGPASLATASRVVLTDHPTLALRLHQEGAAQGNVALIEHRDVIPALMPWLAHRAIVMVSLKPSTLADLGDALGPLNATAERVVSPADVSRMDDDDRAILGIDHLRAPIDRPPITPRLMRDLHAYARARVAAGEATDALARYGLSDPTIIAAYGIGFLPVTFREAVSGDQRAAFACHNLGATLVLPAYDEQGAIVDLLIAHTRAYAKQSYAPLCAPPRGLLAPTIATAHESLIITTTLHIVGALASQGTRNVLFMRGPEDVAANAARLAAAGVTSVTLRVQHSAAEMADALQAVGIAVTRGTCLLKTKRAVDAPGTGPVEDVAPALEPEPDTLTLPRPVPNPVPTHAADHPKAPIAPAPVSPALVLAEHNQQDERATFTAGALTYVVEVLADEHASHGEVVLRHADKVHRDRLDLAVEAQRLRFASSAAQRCGVPAAVIDTHLLSIRDRISALQATVAGNDDAPAVTVPAGPNRDAALQLLRAPDLLDRIAADLGHLGWVGEADAKRVLLLTALSRKLPDPLWTVRTTSSSLVGSQGLDLLAALTPPEDLIHVSRLSNAALSYQDADALRHKLLIIDEATTLSTEVITALRVLHARGALSQAIVPRHNLSGSARTRTIEVRGPLAVLAAGIGRKHDWFSALCCTVAVDGSPEQTARVLAAERHRYAAPQDVGTDSARTALLHRHHLLQRLLARRPVVIPFAERITFPAATLHQRGEQARFLSLIMASALLHQYQRLTDREHIVADERDFHIAVSVARAAGIGADPGMSQSAAELAGVLLHLPDGMVTMGDLRHQRPTWTRHAFRAALQELMEADLVTSPAGGKGKERTYLLDPAARVLNSQQATITLVPADRVREVGEVGGSWRGDDANFIPCQGWG